MEKRQRLNSSQTGYTASSSVGYKASSTSTTITTKAATTITPTTSAQTVIPSGSRMYFSGNLVVSAIKRDRNYYNGAGYTSKSISLNAKAGDIISLFVWTSRDAGKVSVSGVTIKETYGDTYSTNGGKGYMAYGIATGNVTLTVSNISSGGSWVMMGIERIYG